MLIDKVKHKDKYVSMLSYFEVPENLMEIAPTIAALWNTYTEKDEKYRNDRLKMIARCPKISFCPCADCLLTKRPLVCEEVCGQRTDDHRSQAPSEDIPRGGLH